ncbi:MAG TPA: Fe-S cluster assembly protein SufD [Burkholderiales bacterium]|jgi:Fe-S cluster assembly protein SufD|nr:Fe-S cluster assembly protein SufD [Burkholderiales bacterium]
MATDVGDTYLQALLDGRAGLPETPAGWQRELRRRAFERANALTVPGPRDEEWRFTDLAPLYKLTLRRAAALASVPAGAIDGFAVPEATIRLVFIDGHYAAALSRPDAGVGVSVANLADAGSSLQDLAERHLGRLAAFDADPFVAVNTACLGDGAVIHVAGSANAPAPIHVLHVSTQRDGAAHPRVLVVAEPGTECTVVEEFAGLPEATGLTNAVTEIQVAQDAHVRHVKLQKESAAAFHIANTSVSVGRDGRFSSWSLAFGARLSRHDLRVRQEGEGTEFLIDGLSLIGGRQLADTHSSLDHACPGGRSRQLHKTIAGGGAHAVFNGKILVREGAQRTDSGQQSRNLLLSDKAIVDTKPQLEIFADDVKCAHGATVGQIEAEELFYLKSRGLPDAVARNLLTYAFAAEIIERIPVDSVSDRCRKHVLEQTQGRQA